MEYITTSNRALKATITSGQLPAVWPSHHPSYEISVTPGRQRTDACTHISNDITGQKKTKRKQEQKKNPAWGKTKEKIIDFSTCPPLRRTDSVRATLSHLFWLSIWKICKGNLKDTMTSQKRKKEGTQKKKTKILWKIQKSREYDIRSFCWFEKSEKQLLRQIRRQIWQDIKHYFSK